MTTGAARTPVTTPRSRNRLHALRALAAVAALLAWHVAATVPVAGGYLLPRDMVSTPLDVGGRVWSMFATGMIWKHLGVTLAETVLSFGVGAAGGLAWGLWFARRPHADAANEPAATMANALPWIVLAPLFVLWLGLGLWSKVALGAVLVFVFVAFDIARAVREVSPMVIANARMLGMGERQLLRHVYWPSALSRLVSSLHRSAGLAFVGAVVGEYLGAKAGLGHLVRRAEGATDATGVFAGLIVLAVLVLAMGRAIATVERRLLPWRPRAVA
ncbi:MAG: ABC transporter permease [Burkholderiales bacterium]|nr:ABC transporter permease [Burkholderiales bacterium]